MKYSKKLFLLFIIVIATLSCKTPAIVPGGWVDQKVDAPIVVKALKFLRTEAPKNIADIQIVEVLKAQTQVVAGYNIALRCKYKTKEKEGSNLEAIVFIDLKDTYTLVKFEFDIPQKVDPPKE